MTFILGDNGIAFISCRHQPNGRWSISPLIACHMWMGSSSLKLYSLPPKYFLYISIYSYIQNLTCKPVFTDLQSKSLFISLLMRLCQNSLDMLLLQFSSTYWKWTIMVSAVTIWVDGSIAMCNTIGCSINCSICCSITFYCSVPMSEVSIFL